MKDTVETAQGTHRLLFSVQHLVPASQPFSFQPGRLMGFRIARIARIDASAIRSQVEERTLSPFWIVLICAATTDNTCGNDILIHSESCGTLATQSLHLNVDAIELIKATPKSCAPKLGMELRGNQVLCAIHRLSAPYTESSEHTEILPHHCRCRPL